MTSNTVNKPLMQTDTNTELREQLIDAMDDRRFDNGFPPILHKGIVWLVDNGVLAVVKALIQHKVIEAELRGELKLATETVFYTGAVNKWGLRQFERISKELSDLTQANLNKGDSDER